MRNTTRRLMILATFCSLLLACDKDSLTEPDDNELSGEISFDYSGSGYNGRVNIVGEFELNAGGNIQGNVVAIGVGPQSFFGEHDKGARYDWIAALFSAATAGSYTANESCDPGQNLCAFIEFGIDLPNDDDDGEDWFVMNSGEVKLTSVAGERLKGTFSGTAEREDGTATITITNGKFDVPIVDPDLLPGLKNLLPAVGQKGGHLRL
jgi:hypothetical protein